MAKVVKNNSGLTTKTFNKVTTIKFNPVGSLVSPKLALYSYFGKFSGTADYTQSGKKFCKVYGGNSLVELTDVIPIVKGYEFKNVLNSSQNYSPFANAYISGKINTIIEDIKDYVRLEFPAKANEIAKKTGAEREKAKSDFRNYVQNDLLREIVKATIAETDPAFTPTMTFLLNPLAILEEFMDFEHDIVIEYDENGTLKKVGDLEATDGHLFLWDLAKAPLDAENATPMNQGLDEYTNIKNGDTIIIYLS